MTGFTLDTSASTIVMTSIVQGIGLGLVFVPLSAVAFLTLPTELRTSGTAITTLVRNIGSSIGISMVIAQLTSRTTIMHARLVENVTPFNDALHMPDVARVLDTGTDAGRAMLDQIVTQQASVIAYANAYRLLMVLTLAMVPLVAIIGRARSVPSAKLEAHAME
jgi:DHA2 family multidrug resistance protein